MNLRRKKRTAGSRSAGWPGQHRFVRPHASGIACRQDHAAQTWGPAHVAKIAEREREVSADARGSYSAGLVPGSAA